METDFAVPPPRRRRWRFFRAKILLGGAVGLIVLLCLAVGVFLFKTSRDLDAELARIRAAGEPASAEELEAFYKSPPADQDTTQLWLSAFAPLDTPEFKAAAKDLPFVGELRAPIPWPGAPWSQLEAAEKFVANYRQPLKVMLRAADKGGQARYPTRFSDGLLMKSPHIGQIFMGTSLLSLEAAVAAHRGRMDEAVDAVVAIFAAARSVESEPGMYPQFASMSLNVSAGHRTEWLLSAAALDDLQLRRLDAELAAKNYQQVARLILLGERVLGFESLTNPTASEEGATEMLWTPLANGDRLMFLQLMAKVLVAAENTGKARSNAINDYFHQEALLRHAVGAKWRYPLTPAMLPPFAYFEVSKRDEVLRDIARVTVAIERFQLRLRRLPEKLDELKPDFIDIPLIDAFDGAPLRYRIDPAEYLVYSVGEDRIDQRGVSEPEDYPADWVFRVRRKDVGQLPDSRTAEPQP